MACWAHARRKWHDLRGAFPAAWEQAQRHIAGLYGIEKACNASRPAEDASPAVWSAWHTARARHRADEAAGVTGLLDGYFAWCRRVQDQVKLPKDARFKAAAYSLNQEAELRRYAPPAPPEAPTAVGVLEIDNNACERSIRPLCLGKKNRLFTGSPRAGEAAAVLLSLIGSAMRHGREPRGYLEALFRELPKLGGNPTDAQLEPRLPDRLTPELDSAT